MSMRPFIVSLVAVATWCAPAAAQAAEVELIVRRDAGLTAAERTDIRADAGVDHERRLRLADTEVVSVPAGDAAEALRALRADPDVRWAMRDGELSVTAATGADPFWTWLWALRNTGQTLTLGGVGHTGVLDADMDVPEAWQHATGRGVTVAVVDSGVDFDHPDLAGRLATNPGEIGTDAQGRDKRSNGVDDDGNRLVDDWRGWDFAGGDNDPTDLNGHGTHVTGTIAALNANGDGVSGVAPDAKVLPLQTQGSDGSGTFSAAADAFDLAGDMGVRVVNASLGAVTSVPQVITDAVRAHPNTLYVVSAGNDGLDLELSSYAPCETPAANVVCVGASDQRDAAAGFSNFGTTAVDVFAPGVNIVSTYPGGGYVSMNGTSMASPNTAAVAALVLSRNPSLSAAQVKAALMGTTDAKSGLLSVTGGRVNAERAVLSVAADRDGDGTLDGADSCPEFAGPATNGGCPAADAGEAGEAGEPAGGETAGGEPETEGGETGGAEPEDATVATPPTLSRVTVKLSPCVRGRTCRRRARVTATASPGAALSVRVERRVNGRWVRVTLARTAASSRTVNVSRALATGTYRVTVTASSADGVSAPLRKAFRVRG